VRTTTTELEALDLESKALLAGVPLKDVTVIDLPGGGEGRTLADVRALLGSDAKRPGGNPVVRALFAIRWWLGRVLGWDRARPADDAASYLHRVSVGLRARSLVTPGTPDGPFRTLFMTDHESLSEIQNATVHAFLSMALVPSAGGYRLFWAVYVKPVSRLTPLYMAAIEPFRRFLVYPSLMRRLRRAWIKRYPR
jgi:hypothetical protein